MLRVLANTNVFVMFALPTHVVCIYLVYLSITGDLRTPKLSPEISRPSPCSIFGRISGTSLQSLNPSSAPGVVSSRRTTRIGR